MRGSGYNELFYSREKLEIVEYDCRVVSVTYVLYNTGKTSRARALAHYYNTPVLVIDDVITEALYYSGTPAAIAARLLCTEATARAAADPSPATDSTTDKSGPTQRRGRTLLPTFCPAHALDVGGR